MTEDELLKLIRKARGKAMLEAMSRLAPAERRSLAKPVLGLFREWREAAIAFDGRSRKHLAFKDDDALKVALLATATKSELMPFTFFVIPDRLALPDVMQALRPDWLEAWVTALAEQNPYLIERLAPLWRSGFCPRPKGDAFILGYYASNGDTDAQIADPVFLSHDVWRFFEVEGGGEFSLAALDKYTPEEFRWGTVLVDLCRQGKLDRNRLLDASLTALEHDFGQFRAGWYSRFHTSLAPDLDEQADRAGQYARLLGSTVPPTVSFALKALKALDRAGRISASALLDDLEPALQARQKSTVTTALGLLASAAKRAPECKLKAARLATSALIFEASDIQAKVLDLVERLGGSRDDETRQAVAAYIDSVAPSLRERTRALAGAEETGGDTGAEIPAPLSPQLTRIDPFATPDAALAAFLEALETPRDPFAIERAMDGVARYGAQASADRLQPLTKRAHQVLKSPGDSQIRHCLAATGVAWCNAITVSDAIGQDRTNPGTGPIYHNSFAHVFLQRNDEIIALVHAGHTAPMLSAPSNTTGHVTPGDLIDRLAAYRACGAEPGRVDLQLALMRLAREGRNRARTAFHPGTEAERAVAFALGADEKPNANDDAALWVAAWAARDPATPDAAITALVGQDLPDAGQPAKNLLIVKRTGKDPYFWCKVDLEIRPEPLKTTNDLLTSLYHLSPTNRYFHQSPCGYVFADVAWASLVWPGHSDPFLTRGLLAMDTSQKLSDHFCLGYLEPLLRPEAGAGPMAHAMLAYFLASEDRSVTSMTVEVIVQLGGDGRLDPSRFAEFVSRFLQCGPLPAARWTRAFADIASAAPKQATFIRQVIAKLLIFPPNEAPRDIGGMVELLFELHIAADTTLDNPAALDCLRAIRAGGKLGRFSKKLLAMAG